MEIRFYNNKSLNDCINKQITLIKTVTGVFKEDAPVERFEAIVQYDVDLLGANYCYCPKFGRYYNAKLETMPGSRIKVICEVDPLMSFKNEILNLNAIINKQESVFNGNKYLNDGSFISQVNEFNTSYNFQNGFENSGKFILICAGG